MKIDLERITTQGGNLDTGAGRKKTTFPRTVIIERRRPRRLQVRTGEAR